MCVCTCLRQIRVFMFFYILLRQIFISPLLRYRNQVVNWIYVHMLVSPHKVLQEKADKSWRPSLGSAVPVDWLVQRAWAVGHRHPSQSGLRRWCQGCHQESVRFPLREDFSCLLKAVLVSILTLFCMRFFLILTEDMFPFIFR